MNKIFIITFLLFFIGSCNLGLQDYYEQKPSNYKTLKLNDIYDTVYVKEFGDYVNVFDVIVYYDSDSIRVVEDWIFYGRKKLKKKKSFIFENNHYVEYWYFNKDDTLRKIRYEMLVNDTEGKPKLFLFFGSDKFKR